MRAYRLHVPTIILLLATGFSSIAPGKATEVYKYIDSKGHVHLTDRPTHPGYRLLRETGAGRGESRVDHRNREHNRKRFEKSIATVARRYRVPEALVHAVIATESDYDPNAESRAGAVGLMQLMPATARRYGVDNRRDPIANLHGGTRYLRDLLVRFGNDLELALAGYNAGENAVEKFGNRIPPFDETRRYVRKVLKLYSPQPATTAGDA